MNSLPKKEILNYVEGFFKNVLKTVKKRYCTDRDSTVDNCKRYHVTAKKIILGSMDKKKTEERTRSKPYCFAMVFQRLISVGFQLLISNN